MSIHDHTVTRLRPGRHVARSVLLALRWGLVAFAVMAALRVAWRLTASSKPVRTVEQAVAGAGAGVRPYYADNAVTLYHGDCREIVPGLGRFDLLLTDPPYGIERFRKGFGTTRFRGLGCETKGIEWDVAPEAEWLAVLLAVAPLAVVWGMNNLPLPRTEHFLVWDKEQTVDNFASAELAWCNLPTPAKVFRFSIHRHNQSKAGGHPTEKPLPLLTWCIGLAGDVQTILDPFAVSGTTGRAAKDLGRKATLIEREERYCEIAARRMAQEVLPLYEVTP